MTSLSTRLAAIVIEIDPPHLNVQPWHLINSVKAEHWDDLTKDLLKVGAIRVEKCKPSTGCWYITFLVDGKVDLDEEIEIRREQCYNLYKKYQNKPIE